MIVSWCNGSTTVFGTVSQGSSPCETTQETKRLKFYIGFQPFFQIIFSVEIIIYF